MRAGEHFCPGILHAVPAKDGLLLRIRIPGGLIGADQIRTIADLSRDLADGSIEITSRANLQIRAVRSEHLDRIAAAMADAGLLPSPEHDRVRNIITSPIAGEDPNEIVDPRPLIHDLDLGLRSRPSLAGLHPKFSFAIFGGSRRFSHEMDDILLSAERSEDHSKQTTKEHSSVAAASVVFRVSIGGIDTGFAVARQHVVDAMLSVASACLALAVEYNVPARAKRILAADGAMQRILNPALQWMVPCVHPQIPSSIEQALSGIYPSREDGRCIVAPSVPLGRLSSAQAIGLAEAVSRCGGDLRLTPWRAVVLGSVPQASARDIAAQLQAHGMSCDTLDGFHGLAACAGITGCDASLADVRGDATRLANRLSGMPAPRGWNVNLSGCEKQCGRRHQASAELVATATGYRLHIAGQETVDSCSQSFAIDAIATYHQRQFEEAAHR